MKIIDLLNKIANDEEVPKKIRIEGWTYKFEWIEHDENYYDKHEDIDLMSCLSMCEDELNREVEIIEEEKKIKKLPYYNFKEIQKAKNEEEWYEKRIALLEARVNDYHNKTNELIDEINSIKENK